MYQLLIKTCRFTITYIWNGIHNCLNYSIWKFCYWHTFGIAVFVYISLSHNNLKYTCFSINGHILHCTRPFITICNDTILSIIHTYIHTYTSYSSCAYLFWKTNYVLCTEQTDKHCEIVNACFWKY